MNKVNQQTIEKSITFQGIGLHSGKISKVKILPGATNLGIIFKRVDLEKNNIVEAKYNNVSSAKLCTTLENNFGTKVSTVEHLLAAFYILGIDNVTVEVNNEEVPIMDGSSQDFIEIISNVRIKKQNLKRKFMKILNKVELESNGRKISIEPNDNKFEVKFQLDYSNDIIGKQKNLINFYSDNLKDVYSSRTFCLFEDIEKIKKIGLAKGGSLENAIVVDKNKIINKNGLRNEKEFVNHKILDLAGDFFLSGYRILGKVDCYQGGHQLSNLFLHKLINSKTSYSIVDHDTIEHHKKEPIDGFVKLAVNA